MAKRNIHAVLIALIFWTPGFAAHSDVFRCVDEIGQTTFSDKWCGSNAAEHEIEESSGGLSEIEGDGLSPKEKRLLDYAEQEEAW